LAPKNFKEAVQRYFAKVIAAMSTALNKRHKELFST